MKRTRGTDEDDGGLDSLLDTMTNVVGILVLVLIVTQMSVADVVTRLTTENQIDEETVEQLNQQLVVERNELRDLEKILVNPIDIDEEKLRQELQLNKELLARKKELLEQRSKEKNEFALKITNDEEMAAKNSKIIADTEAKRKELETLISTSLNKKAKLAAQLEKTPRVKAPADIQISIPNPRPAPPGIKQLMIICSGNRIYPVNIDAFRKDAELKAKSIITRFNLKRDPAKGIDPAKFKQHYEKLKQQDDFFDVEYYVQGDRWPRFRLIPRENKGGFGKELINPRSRLRRWFSTVDFSKYYARFYVLPDSFDAYVMARRFFSQNKILAGWDPQNENWKLTSHVTGGIELGPPRPKPPPPPPGTPPPAKPKPANLID
ncbi:MAG: hypothetical protein ACR2OA_14075 [Rubripirellula sp.]